MERHTVSGVAAVVENANIASSDTVWVNSEDVPKALDVVRKQSDRNYPDVKVYKQKSDGGNRVALE